MVWGSTRSCRKAAHISICWTLASDLLCLFAQVAPNLSALIGETVGARLISHAGSLTNLAKYPASTVQILGAEKALFRCVGGVARVCGSCPNVDGGWEVSSECL